MNARDAMPEGGRIPITVSERQSSGEDGLTAGTYIVPEILQQARRAHRDQSVVLDEQDRHGRRLRRLLARTRRQDLRQVPRDRHQGWATMPGSVDPDRNLATACAQTISAKF